jgi:MMPL family
VIVPIGRGGQAEQVLPPARELAARPGAPARRASSLRACRSAGLLGTARAGTRQGAIVGLGATGAVIISAGAVLAGTFAALSTLPLVIFTEIGFTVALGVLLDASIGRCW